MSTKTANWIMAAGAVLMFIGLCFLPAALGEQPDADLLELGACHSRWALSSSPTGIYAKARAVQIAIASGLRGKNLHPPISGFAAVVTYAEPRPQRCNAGSTSLSMRKLSGSAL